MPKQKPAPLRPLRDHVLVKRLTETTSKGGIVIPDTEQRKGSQRGTVLAIGPGRLLLDGHYETNDVKVGDVVVFGELSGHDVKINGDDYLVLDGEDLIGVETPK